MSDRGVRRYTLQAVWKLLLGFMFPWPFASPHWRSHLDKESIHDSASFCSIAFSLRIPATWRRYTDLISSANILLLKTWGTEFGGWMNIVAGPNPSLKGKKFTEVVQFLFCDHPVAPMSYFIPRRLPKSLPRGPIIISAGKRDMHARTRATFQKSASSLSGSSPFKMTSVSRAARQLKLKAGEISLL
jgi:hypothetical protein